MKEKLIVTINDIKYVKNEIIRDLLLYLEDNADAIYHMDASEFGAVIATYVVSFYGISDTEFVTEAVDNVYKVFRNLNEYIERRNNQ